MQDVVVSLSLSHIYLYTHVYKYKYGRVRRPFDSFPPAHLCCTPSGRRRHHPHIPRISLPISISLTRVGIQSINYRLPSQVLLSLSLSSVKTPEDMDTWLLRLWRKDNNINSSSSSSMKQSSPSESLIKSTSVIGHLPPVIKLCN